MVRGLVGTRESKACIYLADARDLIAAEVTRDGTVETIGTLGQGGQYPLIRFTTDSMGVWNTLTMVA